MFAANLQKVLHHFLSQETKRGAAAEFCIHLWMEKRIHVTRPRIFSC